MRKGEFSIVELEGQIFSARVVTVVCPQKEENGNNLAGCQQKLSAKLWSLNKAVYQAAIDKMPQICIHWPKMVTTTYCQEEKICYYFTIIVLHREKVLSSDNLICQNKVLFSTNLIEKSEFKICSYCSVYPWITMTWFTYCQGIIWKTSEKKIFIRTTRPLKLNDMSYE